MCPSRSMHEHEACHGCRGTADLLVTIACSAPMDLHCMARRAWQAGCGASLEALQAERRACSQGSQQNYALEIIRAQHIYISRGHEAGMLLTMAALHHDPISNAISRPISSLGPAAQLVCAVEGASTYQFCVIFSVDSTRAYLPASCFNSRSARPMAIMPAEQPMPAQNMLYNLAPDACC